MVQLKSIFRKKIEEAIPNFSGFTFSYCNLKVYFSQKFEETIPIFQAFTSSCPFHWSQL